MSLLAKSGALVVALRQGVEYFVGFRKRKKTKLGSFQSRG
jgi:hypothetical protein